MSFIRKEDAPALAIANIDAYFCTKGRSGTTAPPEPVPHSTEAASGGSGGNASSTTVMVDGLIPDVVHEASEALKPAPPPPLPSSQSATAAVLQPAALLSRSQSMPAPAPRHAVRRGVSERLDHARLPYILERAQSRVNRERTLSSSSSPE